MVCYMVVWRRREAGSVENEGVFMHAGGIIRREHDTPDSSIQMVARDTDPSAHAQNIHWVLSGYIF